MYKMMQIQDKINQIESDLTKQFMMHPLKTSLMLVAAANNFVKSIENLDFTVIADKLKDKFFEPFRYV